MERVTSPQTEIESRHKAMAFCSSDYRKTVALAERFAGPSGHLAILPDIIDARLSSDIHSSAWTQYFTTQTAEYVGYTKGGNKIIVVAHGIGPMSTTEGVIRAYNNRLKPARSGRTGTEGRISQKQFSMLIDGLYGPVEIVDFDETASQYEYPFLEMAPSWVAKDDPLVKARLGVSTFEYLARHHDESESWAKGENITSVERFKIIANNDNPNSPYQFLKPGEAPLAHLLSVSQLFNINGNRLGFDIGCHEKGDGVRLVGVRSGEDFVKDICPSTFIDVETVNDNLDLFLKPNEQKTGLLPFVRLTNVRDRWFTERIQHDPEHGPQFVVTGLEKVGETIQFRTQIKGYHMFVRYDDNDIKAVAPPEANAYHFPDEWKIDGETHVTTVDFYKIEADTDMVIPPLNQFRDDFDTLVQIAER